MIKVELIDNTKLSTAVEAGRVCYNSYHLGGNYEKATDNISEVDKKYLTRLLHQHGHYSISRHVKYVFKVCGISTKTLLALSRHQIAVDLSVMSSRFCKLDKFGNDYTETPNKAVNELLQKHITEIIELNTTEKVSAEDLAMLYPQAMQYDLVLSFNIQSLQHLFDMRLGKDSHAHFDIQNLAQELYNALPEVHKFLYKVRSN